jgi:UDP-glucose 4-epimerase
MEVFNIGTGVGYSVKQVVDAFQKVSGISLNHSYGPRRPGDVEKVWANPSKANNILLWKPKRDLDEMLRSAWNWQKTR